MPGIGIELAVSKAGIITSTELITKSCPVCKKQYIHEMENWTEDMCACVVKITLPCTLQCKEGIPFSQYCLVATKRNAIKKYTQLKFCF